MFSKPIEGELRDLWKEDVVKHRKEFSELTQKRTPLHKRRIILSSTKVHLHTEHGLDNFLKIVKHNNFSVLPFSNFNLFSLSTFF